MHAILYTILYAKNNSPSIQRIYQVPDAPVIMKNNQQVIDIKMITESQFIERFGGLYEHSPWVARAVWAEISGSKQIERKELSHRMRAIVDGASDDRKMRLLRAHPELAGKAAVQGELTPESTDEQSRARLDLCTADEFATFQRLNSAYNDKFGFPFIMAVRNSTREQILEAFESRLHNTVDHEFDTALAQVHQIALLRLEADASFNTVSRNQDVKND